MRRSWRLLWLRHVRCFPARGRVLGAWLVFRLMLFVAVVASVLRRLRSRRTIAAFTRLSLVSRICRALIEFVALGMTAASTAAAPPTAATAVLTFPISAAFLRSARLRLRAWRLLWPWLGLPLGRLCRSRSMAGTARRMTRALITMRRARRRLPCFLGRCR